jgi:hypothetical protein
MKDLVSLLIVVLVVGGAFYGMICGEIPNTSHNAITDADREWVNNTTQTYNSIGHITKDIKHAHDLKDYENVKIFAKALTLVTEKAVMDNFNVTLSPGMVPAQKAYEESLMILHDSTMYLYVYADSKGKDKSSYKEYLNEKDESIEYFDRYLTYL